MDPKSFSSPVLWDNSNSVQNRLRQPKLTSSPAFNQEQGTATCSKEFNVANSKLKPEAPEFVPASQRAAQSKPEQYYHQNVQITVCDEPPVGTASVQNRLHKFKGSSQQPEVYNCYPPEYSENVNGYHQDETTDMLRLKQLISSLINYPGQFDDLLMVFMETIFPYFNDIIAISEISKLLVGEAINSPNFRYNGARLCWYVEQKCAVFRAELHLHCQKELQENPNQQSVLLFVAELYTQLPHDTLYGSLLTESMKKLLELGGNDNVKCLCQALKLTGYSLEEHNKDALDEIFFQLRSLRNSLSGSALILLNSVINLRESNWGRSAVESSSAESLDFDENEYEDMVDQILYDTDGQVLTNEEREFLMAHATNDEYLSDHEDPDALCNPEPEMDEEIQAAFEEFVKLSKG